MEETNKETNKERTKYYIRQISTDPTNNETLLMFYNSNFLFFFHPPSINSPYLTSSCFPLPQSKLTPQTSSQAANFPPNVSSHVHAKYQAPKTNQFKKPTKTLSFR